VHFPVGQRDFFRGGSGGTREAPSTPHPRKPYRGSEDGPSIGAEPPTRLRREASSRSAVRTTPLRHPTRLLASASCRVRLTFWAFRPDGRPGFPGLARRSVAEYGD